MSPGKNSEDGRTNMEDYPYITFLFFASDFVAFVISGLIRLAISVIYKKYFIH